MIMLHTGKDLPALTGKDIFEVRAHYREKIGVPHTVWDRRGRCWPEWASCRRTPRYALRCGSGNAPRPS